MSKIQETPIMALCHAVRNAFADMECSLRQAVVAHGVGKIGHSIARASEIYSVTHKIDGAVKTYCQTVGGSKNAEIRPDIREALDNL